MTPKFVLCVLLFQLFFLALCSEPVSAVPRELLEGCGATGTSRKDSFILDQEHLCSVLSPAECWHEPGAAEVTAEGGLAVCCSG